MWDLSYVLVSLSTALVMADVALARIPNYGKTQQTLKCISMSQLNLLQSLLLFLL